MITGAKRWIEECRNDLREEIGMQSSLTGRIPTN